MSTIASRDDRLGSCRVPDYDHGSIEPKWQRRWEEKRCFEPPDLPARPKFYCLEMLPYPSGRIHMGHVRNYSIGDTVARFRVMRGFDVIHPMGWDSFGMPAENAAIQRSLHPKQWTASNIEDMRAQLKMMGFGYAWSREIATHTPEYYRWNQWLFIQMYRRDLAYRALRQVNWCPSCLTVLANEQVEAGACWRCRTTVVNKELQQWFFRIGRYAEELLEDLDRMPGWPERVLTMQRNWIGRSEGAWVDFRVEGGGPIRVFTTRIDTIYGATFLALAPEHPAVEELLSGSPAEAGARKYLEGFSRAPAADREGAREKSGVFTGRHAINPFTGRKIPIWLADFVMMDYGTGAIMAVPGHDERDHEFATRYGLPVVTVIAPVNSEPAPPPFTDDSGRTVESGPFSGLSCAEARAAMTRHAESEGFGEGTTQFRLKDWGISRQRYWGTPIPMIHCASCGIVPVPESDLPILLPDDVTFTGKGGSPLETSTTFHDVRCPSCGGPARRETDTMDTFVDSSWYFFRYLDPANEAAPFRKDLVEAWFPIDLYVGGITHAILHLMYARFFGMVLRDLGLAARGEPVERLLCQGMVLKDGGAMSKSRGNVVAPDDMVRLHGADVTRLFVLFAAPPEKDLEWSDSGVDGLERFVRRFWRLIDAHASRLPEAGALRPTDPSALQLRRKAHQTLARVTDDIDRRLHLNTAIAAIMELVNALYLFAPPGPSPPAPTVRPVLREALEITTICLAPFAPHVAEEAWERLGRDGMLATHPWPAADPRMLEEDRVTIVVQVGGKMRGRLEVPAGADRDTVMALVRDDERLAKVALPRGAEGIARVVFVPDKLINIVPAR